MLFVLSPAKTLDFTPAPPEVPATRPEAMAKDTRRAGDGRPQALAVRPVAADVDLRQAGRAEPPALPGLRSRQSDDGSVQAVIAFDGDVYDGLDARSLDRKGWLNWAQDNLRDV